MSTVRRPVGRGVLLRYRVLAYVTAVLLLPLVFVATPLEPWGGIKAPATRLGLPHRYIDKAQGVRDNEGEQASANSRAGAAPTDGEAAETAWRQHGKRPHKKTPAH